MAIDLTKIIQAAAEAALEGQAPGQQQQSKETKRRGLTAPRALLLGAGVYTAGRLLVRGRGGGLVENLQDRLGDLEHRFLDGEEDEGSEDEDLEDDFGEEEPEGEYDEEEEPAGEYDEEEEPEGEYDEEEEPEGEYDEEEDEEDEEERPRRRRTSSASSRNGRD